MYMQGVLCFIFCHVLVVVADVTVELLAFMRLDILVQVKLPH